MAVLDDDDKKTGSGGFSDKEQVLTIDINDTSLEDGPEQDINPNADAWDQPQPPPDGDYLVKFFLSKSAFEVVTPKEGEKYWRCNLEAKIQDNEKWGKAVLFQKLTSSVAAGKEISTILTFIKKTGVDISKYKKTTPLEQCRLLKKVLTKEPKLYIQGEWKAWDQKKEVWLKQGMKTFPKNEDGKSYNHVLKDSGGNTVVAKFKIGRIYGLKEWREEQERLGKAKKNNTQTTAPVAAANSNVATANTGGGEGYKEIVNNTPKVESNDDDFVVDE